ncbi:hypothetical protein ABE473_04740 [Stenotrophomonas sp. TWI700]|uniref:hypothetical protein n=1 Tax=Stenotrophomonas sp. TWI700 TaxID=3136792 RepID=UPI00320A1C56
MTALIANDARAWAINVYRPENLVSTAKKQDRAVSSVFIEADGESQRELLHHKRIVPTVLIAELRYDAEQFEELYLIPGETYRVIPAIDLIAPG